MKIKVWLARDKEYPRLGLYRFKPERQNTCFFATVGIMIDINKSLFPEITWDNSPIEAWMELIIIPQPDPHQLFGLQAELKKVQKYLRQCGKDDVHDEHAQQNLKRIKAEIKAMKG